MPECGSEDSKEIVYGFPDEETIKRADSGEIVSLQPHWSDGPDRKCVCGAKYFSDPFAKEKNDRDTAIQESRIEAQKSGATSAVKTVRIFTIRAIAAMIDDMRKSLGFGDNYEETTLTSGRLGGYSGARASWLSA